MKKRILAMAMALVLCLSFVPMAFAANPPGMETVESITINITDVPGLTATLTNALDHYIKYTDGFNNYFSFSEAQGSVSFNQDVVVFMPTDGLHYSDSEYYATELKADEVLSFDEESAFDGFLLYTDGSKSLTTIPTGEFRGVCFSLYPVALAISDVSLESNPDISKESIYDLAVSTEEAEEEADEPEETPVQPIAEVPSEWAAEEVAAAIEIGLVPENLQQNYAKAVSRGDVAEMIVNLLEQASGKTIDELLEDKEVEIDADAFSDTDDAAVLAANALGIINGTGDGKFSPDGTFTRAQIAAIINRIAGVMGIETEGFTHDFTDVEGNWVDAELGWPVSKGIINGVGDNKFNPAGALTTEQAIAIMYRALPNLVADAE